MQSRVSRKRERRIRITDHGNRMEPIASRQRCRHTGLSVFVVDVDGDKYKGR